MQGRNGHGKSTPFEVLQHVFFGTTSRGVKKDGIGCAVPATDGFLAEVVLKNPDGRWLIRQSRNHSRYKTAMKVMREVDGEWRTSWQDGGCPKKLEDAQKLAGSLLGLQQHEFAGCMYLSQASAHTLIEGTPAEKMRYIAQLFGLDVCDRMVGWLKAELKQAEELTVEAPHLEERYTMLLAELAGYDVPRPEDDIVLQQAVEVAAQRKTELLDSIYRARDDLKASEQAEDLRQQRARFGDVKRVDEIRERIGRLQVKRDLLRDRLATGELYASITQQLAELPKTNGTVEEMGPAIDETRSEIVATTRLIDMLDERTKRESTYAQLPDVGNAQELRERFGALETEYANATVRVVNADEEVERLEQMAYASKQGQCPTCGQAIDHEQVGCMLDTARKNQRYWTDRAVELHGKCEELERTVSIADDRDKLAAEIAALPAGNIAAKRERIVQLKRRLVQLESDRTTVTQAATLLQQRDRLQSEDVDDLKRRIARHEALLGGLQGELQRATQAEALDRHIAAATLVDRDATESLLQLTEQAYQDLQDAEAVVRERLVRAGMAIEQYRQIEAELADVKGRLDALAEPCRRARCLGHAVAATQKLKRKKLHEVVEAIRDCLPRFASTMFSHEPNSRFVVSSDDESLDLVCRRRVDGMAVDIPVKSFSGGEKQRLSVALVFTLHALLHARKRPDLLILDEVDRGLDDVGIASLMSLVRSVREQYGTVIMTSHRSQIAGAAFDRTWIVMKQNETSSLETGG